jgi:SAM-dependent methyltransferase
MQLYWNRNRVVDSAVDQESIWRGRYREAEIWAGRTWDVVQPFMPTKPGRFLDIACGLGATAKFFQDRGWYAEGQDADPNTRAAHEHFGIKSTIGQIENIRYDEPFDFISIAHAIYFISDPVGFIRRVRGMLRPGGVFIVLLSDLLSAHSGGGPSYVHTWFPTGESLAVILEREGFVVRRNLRMKGSIFVVATWDAQGSSADSALPPWVMWRIYARHCTHRARHQLWGRPRRMAVDMVKKIIVRVRR